MQCKESPELLRIQRKSLYSSHAPRLIRDVHADSFAKISRQEVCIASERTFVQKHRRLSCYQRAQGPKGYLESFHRLLIRLVSTEGVDAFARLFLFAHLCVTSFARSPKWKEHGALQVPFAPLGA